MENNIETKQLIRSIYRNSDLDCEDFIKEKLVKIDERVYIKHNEELILMDDEEVMNMCLYWD